MSSDRLWMMEHHCKRWGSIAPVSIAVFTNQTLDETEQQLIDLWCNPQVLTVQVLSSTDLQEDYPVNVLRNMALSFVSTSHVMYTDVDFWESEDLHEILQHPNVRNLLAIDSKRAIVVPAFQLNRQCQQWRDCRELNVPKMPRNKQDLIHNPDVRLFDPTNPGGHGSTLYKTWLRHCRNLPPFHEEFSGYGKNKMTTAMHMKHVGYQFSQIGGAFVVHYPHLDSKSRMDWDEKPQELKPFLENGKWHQRKPKDVHGVDWMKYKRGRMDQLFVEFKAWLSNEIVDESRVPRCDDFGDDDTNLWINHRSED